MKLDKLNPSIDDLINMDSRILYGAGDIWRTDADGVPHRLITMYGDLLTVKVPENVPMKYAGKKLRRLIVACNACDTVTGMEARYTGGRTLVFRDPESRIFEDLGRL